MYKTQHSPNLMSYFYYSFPPISLNYTVPMIQCCQDDFNSTLSKIQPSQQNQHHCAMMLSTNLGALEWITVKCDTKKNVDVMCMTNLGATYSTKTSSTRPLNKCLTSSILKGDFCYKFIYFDQNNTIVPKPTHLFLVLNTLENIEFILLALEVNLVILSADPNSKLIREFSYYTFYNTLKASINLKSKSSVKGYFVQRNQSDSATTLDLAGNLFQCQNNVIISSSFLCDDINDCGDHDTSDEKGCQCNVTESNFRKCKLISKQKTKYSCTFLFSLSQGCGFNQLYNSMIKKNQSLSKKNIHCFEGQVQYSQFINDLVPDCEYDEPHLHNVYRNLATYSCPSPNFIPCRKGHSQCFTIADTCVYRLNKVNNLIPCRTGEHIQKCKEFDCNLMFKCPGYYCTPLAYVCDGKWDCPQGYDELFSECGHHRLCKHLYRCRNSQICLHIEDTCDRYLDCPEDDDEQFCQLTTVECPIYCLCHVLIIQCINITLTAKHFSQNLPYVSVKVLHTGLLSLWFVEMFSQASYLYFSHNYTNDLCGGFSYNDSIIFLNGSFNMVSKLYRACFCTVLILETLHLDNNLIDIIHNEALVNLPNLKVLTLANNYLNSLHNCLFFHLSKLLIFSIINNPLSLKRGTFENARMRHVISDSYQICCIVPSTISCNATQPWYISCSTLLPTFSMRLLLAIIVCLVLLLNFICLILQLKTKNLNTFHFIIISINSTDVICGLYLMMLLIFDGIFQENFIANESKWRVSIPCYVILTLSLIFSIQSPLTVSLMSLSRIIVVISPFSFVIHRRNFVRKFLIGSGLLLSIVSVLIVIVLKQGIKDVPTSLCSPFIDPTNSVTEIKALIILIAVFQVLASFFIATTYTLLLRSLFKSVSETEIKKSKTRSLGLLLLQLVIVTLSNLLSWIPSNVIYLSSLLTSRFSIDLLIWTTIAVTPINSIINPLVFICTTARKGNKKHFPSYLETKLQTI